MKTKDSVLCTGKNHCVKPFRLILMFLGHKFPWWSMILVCYCKYPIMVGVINWKVIVIHLVWSISWSIKNFYFGICQAFFVCHWSVDIPCFTNSLYSLSPLCENTIGKFRKGWEIFCWTESNSGKDFQQKVSSLVRITYQFFEAFCWTCHLGSILGVPSLMNCYHDHFIFQPVYDKRKVIAILPYNQIPETDELRCVLSLFKGWVVRHW